MNQGLGCEVSGLGFGAWALKTFRGFSMAVGALHAFEACAFWVSGLGVHIPQLRGKVSHIQKLCFARYLSPSKSPKIRVLRAIVVGF